MVDINFNGWSDEEYQKFLEQVKNHVIKNSITWRHAPSPYGYEYREEQDIPLEQDENGTYGYKVLIRRIRESPWLFSPNRFRGSEWVNNRISAHKHPAYQRDACGIYASKNMDLLKEWWDNYEAYFDKLAYVGAVQLLVVRIRVWGVVVEHTKGLRAEHAEILEVLKSGHW